MNYFKYYLWFVSVELILLFTFSCSAPRERRGDWMEHLNYRQFTYEAPMMHWNRRNYYSEEELREMWTVIYNRAIKSLEEATAEDEDIY